MFYLILAITILVAVITTSIHVLLGEVGIFPILALALSALMFGFILGEQSAQQGE